MAVAEPISWTPPTSFVSGDTLVFQLSLPNWLPADGWAVRLTATDNQTGQQAAQAVSAPDSTNSFHVFNVPNFCAGLPSKQYSLSEEVFNAAGNAAINVAAGERHQIFSRPDFLIEDNLDAGQGSAPIETEAQEMVRILRESLKGIYRLKYSETESDRNRFSVKDEKEVLDSLKYWKEVRFHEIQMERVANGQSPNTSVGVIFNIGC